WRFLHRGIAGEGGRPANPDHQVSSQSGRGDAPATQDHNRFAAGSRAHFEGGRNRRSLGAPPSARHCNWRGGSNSSRKMGTRTVGSGHLAERVRDPLETLTGPAECEVGGDPRTAEIFATLPNSAGSWQSTRQSQVI